jgi:hypothetical protein
MTNKIQAQTNEGKTQIDRILYIDDSLENGKVAVSVDPRITYVPSLSGVEGSLRDYDCIVSDMQMETPTSGFEVVRVALEEGKLPHIVTGGTYEHGGRFERVSIFDHIKSRVFDKRSKSMPEFWRQAMPYIEENELNDPARIALRLCFSVLGEIPKDSREFAMSFYNLNYYEEDKK